MERQPTPTPRATRGSRDQYSPARLRGWQSFRRPLPPLARGVWLALAVLIVVIFCASLPTYRAQLQTVCVDSAAYGTACTWLQVVPAQVVGLRALGLSPGDYAASMLALALATLGACLAVSALIAWRRPDDLLALLVALMLLTLGPVSLVTNVPATAAEPLRLANACLYVLSVALMVLVFALFPSGHFVPRWTRWPALMSITAQVPYAVVYAFGTTAPPTAIFVAQALAWPALVGELAILVAAQVYRYRRVSTPIERQQTKWVVLGFAVPMSVYPGVTLLSALAQPGSPEGAAYDLALTVVGKGVFLLLPLGFGFAMLRYRLWDVDVLIRRTLVYGPLILTLTVVYAGLVIGLQALLGRLLGGSTLLGQDNTLAI